MNKSIIEGCSKEVNPDLENTYILPGMLPGKPEKAGSWPIVTDDKTDKKFCYILPRMLPGKPEKAGSWPIVTDDKTDKKFCKKCGKECCKEQANE